MSPLPHLPPLVQQTNKHDPSPENLARSPKPQVPKSNEECPHRPACLAKKTTRIPNKQKFAKPKAQGMRNTNRSFLGKGGQRLLQCQGICYGQEVCYEKGGQKTNSAQVGGTQPGLGKPTETKTDTPGHGREPASITTETPQTSDQGSPGVCRHFHQDLGLGSGKHRVAEARKAGGAQAAA